MVKTSTARPVKKNGYSFEKQRARRENRRLEAEARQAAYEKLSLGERLRRAKGQRETNRLLKRMAPPPPPGMRLV